MNLYLSLIIFYKIVINLIYVSLKDTIYKLCQVCLSLKYIISDMIKFNRINGEFWNKNQDR